MPSFQKTKEETEKKMMLKLMTQIEGNPHVSQRTLASELGIALGLMNAYLKRCIKKGWVRATQIPAKRFAYYLTSEGFKEKSQMVADYLSRSLTFFRDARSQCEEIFNECKKQGWSKIALVGEGDLADIAKLVAYTMETDVAIVGLNCNFQDFHAVLITDIMQPQATYENLKKKVSSQQLLTLTLLHISRNELPSKEDVA
jgi:DNA-binding MarR family transcriptional regulator